MRKHLPSPTLPPRRPRPGPARRADRARPAGCHRAVGTLAGRVAVQALALLLVLGAGVAHGPWALGIQSAAFTDVEVDLWPEYDRPDVLVIYRADLAPGVGLPGTVRLRIPAAAGEPNAVAQQQPDGGLVSLPYERTVDGDWATLEITASRPALQVEYYDPGLDRQTAQRRFRWTWPGDHAVSSLTVQVQQPAGASGLETTPAPAGRGVGADGLTYASVPLGGVPEGQTPEVAFTYTKPDGTLTVDALPPPAQGTAGAPGAGDADATAAAGGRMPSPWLVGGVLLLALSAGAGAAWFWRKPAPSSSPDRHTAGVPDGAAKGRAGGGGRGSGDAARQPGGNRQDDDAARRPGGSRQGDDAGSRLFCTRCGAAADPDDRFCHACGSALRKDAR